MAEWIKMRAGLLTNPKVTKMARILLSDPDFRDWYSNAEVTENVTNSVTMRHVTVVTRVVIGGLLPVWATVNESVGRDGHLRHAGLFEVDAMSGIPGFGSAMEAVDWLSVLPDSDGLEFANFIEHNTVSQERSTLAKTDAERAKEYRERKALAKSETVTNGVTKKRDASRDTVTTEKNRVEKIPSSSLRSEEGAADKPRRSPRQPKQKTTLADYLADCKAQGLKAIPDGHAIRTYAKQAGIGDEMLQVAWLTFKDRHTTGDASAKQQKDWPGTFANAVKSSWYRLWFLEGGEAKWTSVGQQERKVHEARLAEHNNQIEGATA